MGGVVSYCAGGVILAWGTVGGGLPRVKLVGVGVIVERSADSVMETGALLACVIGCGVVTDALMACMAVTLSREEN